MANWSFFKVGYGEAMNYRFLVTPPGGAEQDPPIRFMLAMGRTYLDPIVSGGEKMTVAEREEAARKIADEIPRKEARGFGLRVNLAPGETLRTRSWKYLAQGAANRRLRQGEDPFPLIPGEFRELAHSSFKFETVGIYRIRLEFTADPWLVAPGLSRECQMQQHEERLQRTLGRFQSNIVEVEVVP
jgi:hypothetical protein